MYIDATEAIIPGFVDGLGDCIRSPKCGSPLCGCLATRYPQLVPGHEALSDEERGRLRALVRCVVDYLQGKCDPPP
jgi:hypothetical protein